MVKHTNWTEILGKHGLESPGREEAVKRAIETSKRKKEEKKTSSSKSKKK